MIPPVAVSPAYDRIRDRLRTGDIVLFSGKGALSQGIKWFTRSGWSHVGMVVRSQDMGALFLWESTTLSNVVDLPTGSLRKGVQLVSLSQRIGAYDGRVAIRRLLGVRRKPSMLKALRHLRTQLRCRPYEDRELELLKAAWDGPGGANTEDLSSLFCSELVAEAYQAMNLLPSRSHHPGYLPSNEYTPADFCERDDRLPLLRGRLAPAATVGRN